MPTPGIFNPKDNTRTDPVRAPTVLTNDGVQRWYSDSLKTRPRAQDLNVWLANFRNAAAFYAIVDDEIDQDDILKKALIAAVADLNAGIPATVASAATSNIGNVRTSRVNISGNTTITSFGGTANRIRYVKLTGAPLLTHNATSLILPGGQNIQGAIGDTFVATSNDSGNWTVFNYTPATQLGFGLPAASIATDATTDLASKTAFYMSLTGTTGITSFGAGKNLFKLLLLPTGLTLTHSASLNLPGAVDYTTTSNEHVFAWSDAAGNWYMHPLAASGGSTIIAALQALTPAADRVPYFNSSTTAALATFTAFGRSLIDDVDAATARATLGLAAIASSASASDLTSGTLAATRLPAALSSIHTLTPAADRLPYYTGASAAALATFTAFGRSLIDDADAAAARTTLGLAAIAASGSADDLTTGTVAAARLPASLSSIHPLTPAADRMPYYSGASAAALTTLTSFARSLNASVDAAAARIILGVGASGDVIEMADINGLVPALNAKQDLAAALTTLSSATGAFLSLADDATIAIMRTTLGLVAIASSGSASDLIAGTVPSARLPASLSSVHPLTPAADRIAYYTGASAAALTVLTTFARSIIDDVDAASVRATIGLAAIAASGSAADLTAGALPSARLPAALSSIYALTPAADRLPYFTSPTVAALAIFTAFGRSLIDDVDAATARTTLGLADIASSGATADLVGTISNAQLANRVQTSVFGRSANTGGVGADIVAGSNGFVLRRAAGVLAFGTVDTNGITDSAITYAKMQDIATEQRLLGRQSAGSGPTEEVTLSQLLDWIGFAARGDILYRGATTWTRLPKGALGQVLTMGANDPAWAATPDTWVEYDKGALINSTNYVQAHGLSAYPSDFQVWLECTSADGGYAVGDRRLAGNDIVASSFYRGGIIAMNTTNLIYKNGTGPSFNEDGTAFTQAKWKVIFRVKA